MLDRNQLISILNSEHLRKSKYSENEYAEEGVEILNETKGTLEFEGHTLKTEERWGGEGQGDDYGYVFSVSKEGEPTTYWKLPGWYASHDGHTFDTSDLFEVKPVEVMVRQWESVK